MIHIKFKNLEKSELAKDAAQERIGVLVEKFESLKNCKITVTLESENTPTQAGPDNFNVKLLISGGKYDGISVTKSDANLYVALANLVDHMLEKLNRTGDKERVKNRTKARQLASTLADQKAE